MTRSWRSRLARGWWLLPLVVLLALPTVVRAQETDDSADDASGQTPQGPTEPIRLELIDQHLAFEDGGTIRLEYLVTGDLEAASIIQPETVSPSRRKADDKEEAEEDPPPPLVVQVTNYGSIDTVDRLDEVIGSDVDRDDFGSASDGLELSDARQLIEIRDDGTGILRLDLPTDSGLSDADHLRFDVPGLHALRVEILLGVHGFSTVLSTAGTVVQRLPGGGSIGSPLHLSVMGAVDEPPLGGDDTARAQSAGEVMALAEVADAIDSPATWSFPPTVVEALADDVRATDLALALSGDELTSRPATPLDVSSAVAVDSLDVFTRQLLAGEDLLTSSVPTAPTRRDVWIAQDPLSASGAEALRDLGIRYIVMTPQLYAATVGTAPSSTDRFVEIELPDGGRLPLLVVDSIGARYAEGVEPALSPTEFAVHNAAGLLLESVLIPDAGRRSRVIAAPDLGPLDTTLLGELERIAGTTPDLRFTIGSTLTGLTDVEISDGAALTVTLPEQAGPDLTARVELIDTTSTALYSAATMLPGNDPRLEEWGDQLDALVSTGYSDEQVQDEVDEMLAAAEAITGSVVPPEPFTFTLTGKTGEIELFIGNTSDDKLNVIVALSSSKLVFPGGDTNVELQPNDETRVWVPVEARANGTSAVSVEVRSPTGEQLIEPVRLTSRVTTFTGLGQVLTGGLFVVLLTWWFTHWRARRRVELEAGAERHPSGTGSIAGP